MIVLGINAYHGDVLAVLLRDGELVAAVEEERFRRVKHWAGFPREAVRTCLEMGEPICLLEMARNVIRLSGFVPEEDIPIKFVGLRPGEKLSEELIGSEELAEPSGIEGILRIHPTAPSDPGPLREQVARLEALAALGESQAAVAQLSAIVPTFEFQRGERRRRPPHYRTTQGRNTLPRLARCQTAEDLQALLEDVRKDLGFQTIKVRFKADIAPVALNGVLDFEVSDPNPPRDPALLRENGVPSWKGTAEILSQLRTSNLELRTSSDEPSDARVVGELIATKPAWKRRRASENDDELLQMLAEGMGKWIARHQAPGS
jgi:hypothetical protein